MFAIYQPKQFTHRPLDYMTSTDPRVVVDRDVKFFHGSAMFTPEMFEHYQNVAMIDAPNLEAVFHVGNVGPEERITRLAPMHSISVGDIVLGSDGYFMCDPMGWTQLEINTAEAA